MSEHPRAGGGERELHGWGRTSRCSAGAVLIPRGGEDVAAALGAADGALARGAGCSYGDAAQLAGGTVIATRELDRICSIEADSRLVRAQAGVSVARLMAALADHGLTLPVVPGTRHVTLGGAIASDIHGKNHHSDGGFARHVVAMTIVTPATATVEVDRESDPDLFYGTLGGMGLTGVVLDATIRASELPTPWVADDIDRTEDLDRTLELAAGDGRHRYAVAWLDLLAPGRSYGRAIVSRGELMDAPPERPRARRRTAGYPGELLAPARIRIPDRVPAGALTPGRVRALNALRWRSASRRNRERPTPLAAYLFPLDAVADWNRLYGPRGLIQYQFVLPDGRERELREAFELLRTVPVYLAVFKRFGAAYGGPLSFPLAGWTLAVDLPAAAPGVTECLAALDELVAGAGGRVYLTKDSRLGAGHVAAMYPRLDEFRALRERVDPRGVLRSDLSLRLGLGEAR